VIRLAGYAVAFPVPPSLMVAPIGEFANTQNFTTMQAPIPSHTHPQNFNINDYPNTNLRGQSPKTNSNTNLQRPMSADSTITTSSLDYAERMETQPINHSWVEQVNMEEYLSSSSPNQLQANNNKYAPSLQTYTNTLVDQSPLECDATNSHTPLDLVSSLETNTIDSILSTEPLVIPYQTNRPVDPNL